MIYRTDKELIESYKNGDGKSLEILVKRHLRAVYGFCYYMAGTRQDAEDIAQEVFLRAWRNLHRFDTEKKFRTWLLGIARNACIDFLRRKKEIPFAEFELDGGGNLLLDTLADPAIPLPEELERKNMNVALTGAIAHLGVKYRSVLELRALDLTFREIAEKLQEPLHTVKSRYRRAVFMLKSVLRSTPLHQE